MQDLEMLVVAHGCNLTQQPGEPQQQQQQQQQQQPTPFANAGAVIWGAAAPSLLPLIACELQRFLGEHQVPHASTLLRRLRWSG